MKCIFACLRRIEGKNNTIYANNKLQTTSTSTFTFSIDLGSILIILNPTLIPC